jgi:succinate dehydrogenase/fumarate reductase-like Fe-S protein
LIKDIIHDGESVFEVDGQRYYLTLIEEPETTVKEDVEADPELKQKLLQAKKDILDGKVYSTDDVLEMIDQGEI